MMNKCCKLTNFAIFFDATREEYGIILFRCRNLLQCINDATREEYGVILFTCRDLLQCINDATREEYGVVLFTCRNLLQCIHADRDYSWNTLILTDGKYT
jgi:hypothetical protein